MISKGFLRPAADLVRQQLPGLLRHLDGAGPILGLEPSCLLTLADEWPELVPGADTQRVADMAHLAEDWLADQAKLGRCDLKFKDEPEQKWLLHGHCHQKALRGTKGTVAALGLVPGLKITVLDAGCCGMAGSFGFEKDHYDLSVAIANLGLLPALNADPETLIVAPGTSCRHQIVDLTGRRALHPMEVLERQLTVSDAG
jgi:Fe-S oxidoreductase